MNHFDFTTRKNYIFPALPIESNENKAFSLNKINFNKLKGATKDDISNQSRSFKDLVSRKM